MTALRLAAAACGAALLCAAPTAAQQSNPALQALDDALPGTLINDPSSLGWQHFGLPQAPQSVQSPDIPGGGAALRFTIPRAGATAYEAGANAPLTAPIRRGETYTAAFYARTVSASTPDGQGRIGVRFQENVAPYGGFGDRTVTLSTSWQLIEVTGVADRDIPQRQAFVSFQLTSAAQVVEIGQLIVVSGANSIRSAATAPPSAAAALDAVAPEMPPSLVTLGRLVIDPAQREWGRHGNLTARPTTTNVFGRVGTEFTVAAAGTNPWDAGAAVPVRDAIAEGDIVTIAVLARTISASTPDGQGIITVRMQDASPPYDGFADRRLQIGSNWRLYTVRTRAPRAMAAGSAQVALQLAGAAQVIEVGPVYVLRDTPAPTAP